MFARLKQRRALIIGLLTVLTLGVLAVSPWVLWHLAPNRPLDVLVVDKTVATPNYREHAGLLWLLRHEKIVQRSTGRPLADATDYAGVQHTPDGQRTVVPIPERPTDFVYIADTYGVYQDDLTGNPRGIKSPLLHGGLKLGEVRTITKNLRPGATLVAEFNCIASPTVGAARNELSNALGVRWTGWIGRHFAYLELGIDMPLWIPRTWKQQTGQRWGFRGPGYIFVNEQGLLVVLVEGIDTPNEALQLKVRQGASKRYGATTSSQTYDYWFDIMEPQAGAEVLADFSFALTESGRKKARGVPIDRSFPAIVRTTRPGHVAYYFAGDFADQPSPKTPYRYKWMPTIKAWLGAEVRDDQQAVYWRVWVPFMQTILDEAEATARGRADSPA